MKYRRLATICAGFGTVGLGVTVTAIATADDNHPPTQAQIQFATDTADLFQATSLAAIVQEITETTPQNAANGIQSISLVFNDRNRDMRLVGTLQPFGSNDLPADRFERDALALAMTGQGDTSVEKVDDRWFYRRSVPLSNFVPQCAMCHANFASLPSTA